MMYGRIFSILLFILPALIYATDDGLVECNVGGYCYSYALAGFTPIRASKKCDACVAFSCKTSNSTRSVGYGCYEDFVNVCKWIPIDIKMNIKNNIGNFVYNDSTLIFASSNVNFTVVTEIFDELAASLNYTPPASANVTNPINHRPAAISPGCIYDDTPKPSNDSVQCHVRQTCMPSKSLFDGSKIKDDYGKKGTYEILDTKTCSACISYFFTEDKKKIIAGAGCYEDFENALANSTLIPSDVKDMLKNNSNDAYIIGEQYVLHSCNDKDDCYLDQTYNQVNGEALNATILGFDQTYDTECSHQPSKGTQTASFGLTGMAISALIYILL